MSTVDQMFPGTESEQEKYPGFSLLLPLSSASVCWPLPAWELVRGLIAAAVQRTRSQDRRIRTSTDTAALVGAHPSSGLLGETLP